MAEVVTISCLCNSSSTFWPSTFVPQNSPETLPLLVYQNYPEQETSNQPIDRPTSSSSSTSNNWLRRKSLSPFFLFILFLSKVKYNLTAAASAGRLAKNMQSVFGFIFLFSSSSYISLETSSELEQIFLIFPLPKKKTEFEF